MSVTRNTFYNLLGAMTPTALALVTVPLYLNRIGESRYGVLAIVWLLLGYFGSFDLGLSRAATNRIAQLRGAAAEEREQVFWTVCLLNTVLGIAAGVLFYIAGGWIFDSWFKMSGSLHVEAKLALPWIAAAVPIATVTAALTGALEGMQRFSAVNAIQSIGTAFFQIAPLITAYWIGPELQYVIPAAVLIRLLSAIPLVWVVKSGLPLTGPPRLYRAQFRGLFAYGSWVAVTNIVGPILHAFDRFLIGIVLGASAVAYYVVPFQLVSRAQVLPAALSRALFPHLSQIDAAESQRIALRSVVTLASVTTPIIIFGMVILRPFLQLWVGMTFAARAAPVGEILLLGIWVNGLAYVPLALLQARGRPDIVAKFHLLEVGPFMILLWFGLLRFGIVAAAVAWTMRVTADAILLLKAARLSSDVIRPLIPAVVIVASACVCAQVVPFTCNAARLYADATLLLLSCLWALATNELLRAMLVKALSSLNLFAGD